MSKKNPRISINMRIPGLIECNNFRTPSTFTGVTVVIGKSIKFFKLPDGSIFSDRTLFLNGSFGMNDSVRRAWCKLSGVKFIDLKAEIKAKREEEEKKHSSQRMESLRRQAARNGYRLVRTLA
jgi:hypothetical protein